MVKIGDSVKIISNNNHYLAVGSIATVMGSRKSGYWVLKGCHKAKKSIIKQTVKEDEFEVVEPTLTRKVGSQHVIMADTVGHELPLGTLVTILNVGKYNYTVKPVSPTFNLKNIFGANTTNRNRFVKDTDFKQLTTNTKSETMKKQTINTVQDRKDAVLAVAKALAVPNNTITTLELKIALENQYPDVQWDQYYNGNIPGVTEIFHSFVSQGKFVSVDNNGTFQVYADPTKPFPTKAQLAAVPVLKEVTVAKKVYVNTRNNQPVPPVSITVAPALANALNKASKKAAAKTSTPTAPKTSVTAVGAPISRTKALDLMKNNKGHFFTVEFVKKDGSLRKLNGQYVKDQKDSILGYVLVKEASKMKAKDKEPIRNVNLQTLKSLKIAGNYHPIR